MASRCAWLELLDSDEDTQAPSIGSMHYLEEEPPVPPSFLEYPYCSCRSPHSCCMFCTTTVAEILDKSQQELARAEHAKAYHIFEQKKQKYEAKKRRFEEKERERLGKERRMWKEEPAEEERGEEAASYEAPWTAEEFELLEAARSEGHSNCHSNMSEIEEIPSETEVEETEDEVATPTSADAGRHTC